MKNNLFMYLLVILAVSASYGQQIINASLENWQSYTGYQVADSFYTLDQQLFSLLGTASTLQTNDAHSGQSAALLQTIAGPSTTNFPGTLSYGSYQKIGFTNYFFGHPFSGRPTQMNFWYKFVQAGSDNASATILLSKWSASQTEIIAVGSLSISSNASAYTQASVPLTYNSSEIPDTIAISFISSANQSPTPGTMLYIDDISLDYVTEVENSNNQIPLRFSLYQNYPNPFNPKTKIRFSTSHQQHVKLIIYDALGNNLSTLVNGHINRGEHEVEFDGRYFSSGIYYYSLISEDRVITKKCLLLK